MIPPFRPTKFDSSDSSPSLFNRFISILNDRSTYLIEDDDTVKTFLEKLKRGALQLQDRESRQLISILSDANIPNFACKASTIIQVLGITGSEDAVTPIIAWTDTHFGDTWGEQPEWGDDFDPNIAFEALSKIGNEEGVNYLLSHARKEKGNYSSQWDAIYHLGEVETRRNYQLRETIIEALEELSRAEDGDAGYCAQQSYNLLKDGIPRRDDPSIE